MSNLVSDNCTLKENKLELYTPVMLSDEEWASGVFGKVH